MKNAKEKQSQRQEQNTESDFFDKVEMSFKSALAGKESINTLIWCWGVAGYVISYLVLNKLVRMSNYRALDILISLVPIVYFSWHIYVLRKCAPKKPKLSKEEKAKKSAEARKNFVKSFFRKLFLKESITDFNPITITIVVDLLCICDFLSYVI